MKNKTSSAVAFLFLVPLLFACAHTTKENTGDELASASGEENVEAVSENETVASTELESAPATSEAPSVVTDEKATPKAAKPARRHKRVGRSHRAPRPSHPVARIEQPAQAAPIAPQANASAQTAVVRNGSTLNRFYFFRSGDTPEALSRMFYGSPDRAAELVEWNGSTVGWIPGEKLYFRSGTNPSDGNLTSFYLEAGIAPESVTLGDGESVEMLAERRFGSALSAKEIFALNEFRAGEPVASGTRIKVYPSPLVQSVPDFLAASPSEVPVAAAPVEEKQLATTGINAFARHNPLLVGGGAALLVLFGAFFFIQRKRSRSRFDF